MTDYYAAQIILPFLFGLFLPASGVIYVIAAIYDWKSRGRGK